MKKPTKNNQTPCYVPLSIQKLFIYTIGSLYSLQVVFVTWSTFSQSLDGSDYRPQLGYLFSYLLFPVVAFLIAFGLNPRRLSFVSRAFESLLITITGYIAWSIVMMFWPMFFLSSFFSFDYAIFDYYLPVIFLALYSIGLVLLRQRKTWK